MPARVVADELNLARVHARPNFQAKRSHCSTYARRTSDGSGRAVERGEQSIAKGLYLAAPMARDLLPEYQVVLVEQRSPLTVTEVRSLFVESTMSVNMTVASTRSGSTWDREPVRNSSISSTSLSTSPTHGT